MFFHHGFFNPHHAWTEELGIGMQLASAFIVERELEESRERRARYSSDDNKCDKCGRPCMCHKEELRR